MPVRARSTTERSAPSLDAQREKWLSNIFEPFSAAAIADQNVDSLARLSAEKLAVFCKNDVRIAGFDGLGIGRIDPVQAVFQITRPDRHIDCIQEIAERGEPFAKLPVFCFEKCMIGLQFPEIDKPHDRIGTCCPTLNFQWNAPDRFHHQIESLRLVAQCSNGAFETRDRINPQPASEGKECRAIRRSLRPATIVNSTSPPPTSTSPSSAITTRVRLSGSSRSMSVCAFSSAASSQLTIAGPAAAVGDAPSRRARRAS